MNDDMNKLPGCNKEIMKDSSLNDIKGDIGCQEARLNELKLSR